MSSIRKWGKRWAAISLSFALISIVTAQQATLTIDETITQNHISPTLHGAFFEEISHGGDGGLYAELIQNRGFEDTQLPAGTTYENGFLIPFRSPHFGMPGNGVSDWKLNWNLPADIPAWSIQKDKDAAIKISLSTQHPLSSASPHNLKIELLNPGAIAGVANEGYWGINAALNQHYLLSFYLWSNGAYNGKVSASLNSKNNSILAIHRFDLTKQKGWIKYHCILTPNKTDTKAHLVLSFDKKGTIFLDFVSLFPEQTFKHRANGLRKDLATYIADLHPAFLRWPGGCYAEGMNIQSAFNWKNSIGELKDRPPTFSPWGYWSTNGFGYDEYLQFCEDIGAKALFVVNVGVSCEMRSGTFIPDDSITTCINDALDAIEYAIGPISSKWGKLRATNGHPKPYPLAYIELGNEQSGPRYARRYNWFYDAIHAKYPQIKIIASMGLGDLNKYTLDSMHHVDIADEHAYKAAFWPMSNDQHFDHYKRQGNTKVYVGEYATNGGVGKGNMNASLSDAVYIMSMERNGDLVTMSSYAPLLANLNSTDWPVNLINFDNSKSFARISYYLIQMMAKNRADVNVYSMLNLSKQRPELNKPTFKGQIGLATWDTQTEYKDLEILKDGKRIYYSDFTNRPEEWEKIRGTWVTKENSLMQTAPGAQTLAFLKDHNFDTYTLHLKARKLSGYNAFIIPFGITDSNTFYRAHIGSWVNSHCTFEKVTNGYDVADLISQRPLKTPITLNKWYDIRLEVMGDSLACYLDNQLIMTYQEPKKVFALAGKSNKNGDLIIKLVNAADSPIPFKVHLKHVHQAYHKASWEILSAPNAEAENTLTTPYRYMPKFKPLTFSGNDLQFILPKFSISTIRLIQR